MRASKTISLPTRDFQRTTFVRDVTLWIRWIFAAQALLWCAGILALAVRARFYLGVWPRPAFPDPKALPFESHYDFFFFQGYLAFASLVVVPLTGKIIKTSPNSMYVKTRWMFVAGWILAVAMFWIPGIDFVEWFVD